MLSAFYHVLVSVYVCASVALGGGAVNQIISPIDAIQELGPWVHHEKLTCSGRSRGRSSVMGGHGQGVFI